MCPLVAGLYCDKKQSVDTDSGLDPEHTEHVISQGRALVRAIEALDTIKPSGWFEQAVANGPEAQLVLVAEQIAIDQPESLLRLVDNQSETKEDLGGKRISSLLKFIATPAAFLQDQSHWIAFVNPPTSASWLNEIEL